ncbi:MAG TPA: sigma-70 family RNA polymerase sigma factor [Chryseolinea sp.]|nr:sigma-70 family RNA polymerase sigma factor [Chryseolinea sp.]
MKNHQSNTDMELIADILESDRQALGELYSRYYNKVFQKCIKMVKDHDQAFDLAEEALMKSFENLRNFRGGSSFSTWLYTITHRHCLEALRKQRNSNVQSATDMIENDEPLEITETMDTEEREITMFALINALPEEEKKLLLLKYLQGETIDALQQSFEVSSSAIKMRLMRTKEKLNQLYALASVIGLPAVLSQLEQL